MAWQFDQPESGEGLVQAFRRSASDIPVRRFRLRGLYSEVQYTLTRFDRPQQSPMTGRELMEEGVEIDIEDRPGAAVIAYARVE